jgi:hypothetical protein
VRARRHQDAEGLEAGNVIELPFLPPPPPRGGPGGAAGGFAANGMTNTELGDWVEEVIAEHFGCESLLPGVRQGPFDLICGQRVFEVKACTVQASEYKMKPKRGEVERKRAAARKTRKVACSMIAVVDGRTVHVYWREGIGAFRLTDQWHYAGAVTVPIQRKRK